MLETKIADAFSRPLSSAEVSSLLDDVADANASAQRCYEAASAKALDPATPPAATADARKEMEDAQFASRRMEAAAERLRAMLSEALEREQDARAEEARTAALQERNELAEELAALYPPMAEKLTELLRRIEANDGKLALGEGAEDHARAAPTDWRTNPSPAMPSLVRGVRLPAFELSRFGSGYIYDGMRGK